MKIHTNAITIVTNSNNPFHNITEEVNDIVKKSNIQNGMVLVYSNHTTCAIKITEDCRLMHQDCYNAMKRLAPKDGNYAHDIIDLRDVPPDERINGFSHIRQLFMNTSEIIPLISGNVTFGQWQKIFAVELDPARDRMITVMVIGE